MNTTAVPYWVYVALGLAVLAVLLQITPMIGGAILIILVLGLWAVAAQKGVLKPQ